jgi:outer membrane protein TolC
MQITNDATTLARRIAFIVLAIVAPVEIVAQNNSDTLRLGYALEQARAANPSIRAAALRADVSVERIPQAGALPDPVLSLGLMNRDVRGFGMGTAMAMNTIQLTQRFPWPGKLGYAKDRVSHISRATEHEAREIELTVLAEVKSLYVRMAYMDRALQIMEGTRSLLRDFFDVSASMYAVGSGQQQDVLQAQVAVAGMTEDITVMEQNRAASSARLNALLGRDINTPILALELPDLHGPLPSVDSLMRLAAAQRPAYAAASERNLAADAGIRAAGRSFYPDLTFTVGYGHRPDYSDVATVMVGVSLPVRAKSRQSPLHREMLALRTLEDARAVELHNETAARLGELRAEAVRALNLAELYETSILPQARAAVETALSAYRVGSVDFATLVASQLTVNRYSIDAVRLTADYHRFLAQIEALVGGPLGGTP